MPQLTIYVDARTADEVDAAARRSRTSRSAWVATAIQRYLADSPDPREGALRASFGAWEDERTADEIFVDIRAGETEDTERASFDD